MAIRDAGAVPPLPCTQATPLAPTPDDLADAQQWALDNDREALLEHRIAVLTQAAWDVQAETERRLVGRFLHAVGRCPAGGAAGRRPTPAPPC